MSLIGIDLGSSNIKVAAYAVDGSPLASTRRSVRTHRTEDGHSEIDVSESHDAFVSALGELAASPALRQDPPVAISFSSSGREVFPVGADGLALGPCLMTADTRGDEVAGETASRRSPEEWFRLAGHVPRRMDPVNRALWWRRTHPDVTAKARWFMNWHEFYARFLSGRPVVDWSDAGAWAVYDVASGDWSPERIAETGIDRGWLSEVRPNAAPIGPIEASAAAKFGLPPDTLIVTGAWDAFAAAVGGGGVDPGVVSLTCGTWHSFTVPVEKGWPTELVREGLNICPHPGPTGFGILSTNPNGTSVIDWARDLLEMSIPDLERGLEEAGQGPTAVATDAALTPLPHRAGAAGRGATFSGVTLATTGLDLVRALLEAIACEFALTLERLRACGVETRLVRATGGGARLAWWLQLHADVCGIPVEVVEQEEPGAFGAAILAGVGVGAYPSVSEAVEKLVRVSRRFEPDSKRGAQYAAVLQRLGRREVQVI
ncbi:MAG TPA: FGGY family carbohydrate kinase [Candidatus Limnocylindrales bacterium]|nr:FGGY family carbohydrate kinase [Candidatus Limnocylindrales bacterium]